MSPRLRWVLTMAGFVGLLLDVSFHWVSAMYDTPNGLPRDVAFTTVLAQLLIDVDPALVPLWVTLLGMTAHAMFLGGFLFMVGLGMYDYERVRVRGKR